MTESEYCEFECLDFNDIGDREWHCSFEEAECGEHVVWWEKTVEYLYLQDECRKGTDVVPFGGAQERLFGDGVQVKDGEFKIIEFKRSFKEIGTESYKFRGNLECHRDYLSWIHRFLKFHEREDVIGHEPHQISYGFEGHQSLETKAIDYWLRGHLRTGLRSDLFCDYVWALSMVRLPPKKGELSGFVYGTTDGGSCLLDLNDVIATIRANYDFRPDHSPRMKS